MGLFINNYTRGAKPPSTDLKNATSSSAQKKININAKKKQEVSNGRRQTPTSPVQIQSKKHDEKRNSSQLSINKSDIINLNQVMKQTDSPKSHENSTDAHPLFQNLSQQKINLHIKKPNEKSSKELVLRKQQMQNNVKSYSSQILKESQSHIQLQQSSQKEDEDKKMFSQTISQQMSHSQKDQDSKIVKHKEVTGKQTSSTITGKINKGLVKKTLVLSKQTQMQAKQTKINMPQNDSLNRILSFYQKVVPSQTSNTQITNSGISLTLTKKLSDEGKSRGSTAGSPTNLNYMKTMEMNFNIKSEQKHNKEGDLQRKIKSSSNHKKIASNKDDQKIHQKQREDPKAKGIKNRTQTSSPLTSVNSSQIEHRLNYKNE